MKSKGLKRFAKVIGKITAVIVIVIVAVPMLLYIPAVQEWAKDIAVKEASKSTGLDISIERLRVRFPLKVELDGVTVVDKTAADTMLTAWRATVDVAFWPLLKGDISASGLALDSIRYQLGTPDSLLYLTAKIDRAELTSGTIALKEGVIDVDRALVDGADVRLVLKPDTTVTPTTPTPSYLIKAADIEMRRVRYTMQMYPYIDSLSATIDDGRLADGIVDTGTRTVAARWLSVNGVDAAYFVPSPEFLAEHPELNVTAPEAADTVPAELWTVTADSLSLTGRRAVYATAGHQPQPGLDMEYLEATDIKIRVDSFYNRGMEIRVPIKELAGTERCGLRLSATGTFAMDSTAMTVSGFDASANRSRLRVDYARLGTGDITTDPSAPLALKGYASIVPADLITAMPSLGKPLKGAKGDIALTADISGTIGNLEIGELSLSAFNNVKLNARGSVIDIMDIEKASGNITLDGSIANGSGLMAMVPYGMLPEGARIPSMKLDGSVDYAPGQASGNIKAVAEGGDIALNGSWTARRESYDIRLRTRDFPVNAFMPGMGVGRVTASLDATGRGYNPLKLSTSADISLDIAAIEYGGQELRDITLTAKTGGGRASGMLTSLNPMADVSLGFTAAMEPDDYTWRLTGEIRRLDLRLLSLTDDTCEGSLNLSSDGRYNPRNGDITGTLRLADVAWELPDMKIATPGATAEAAITANSIDGSLRNGDLTLRFASECGLDTLMAKMAELPALTDTIIATHSLDVLALQRSLPRMQASLTMGPDNVASDLAAIYGISLSRGQLNLSNDSLMTFTAMALNMRSGDTRVDTLRLDAYQRGKTIVYNASVNNRPGTLDDFASVRVNGFVSDNRLSAFADQRNIKGDQGFSIGLLTTMADSVITARLVPANPIIAYRRWDLNSDNYIKVNPYTKEISADLSLGDGVSTLRLYTQKGEKPGEPEDIVAKLDNIKLGDWLSLSPFAPPIKGDLSADIKLKLRNNMITGQGSVDLNKFYYNRKRVGDFGLNVRLATDPATGFVMATADMSIDSIKTFTARGVLNDTIHKTPLQLDFTVNRFPMKIANPFIPNAMASAEGYINGALQVTGETLSPKFNGYLAFDSATVKVKMLGTPLKLSGDRIPMVDNVVQFDNYTVTAANENPLYINGNIDMSDLANMGVDLNLYANDIMAVNSNRPRGAQVYGKGYLDINANVKGDMRLMRADATLTLLPGSNVTYVLDDDVASSAMSAATGDTGMVTFVSFNDSTTVNKSGDADADLALLLTANINVAEGTTINVDISSDGKNKAVLEGNGSLTYMMTPLDDGRLTGRYNINSGFVRYTPPLMSEKLFNFKEDSYVAFTGDMLNPTLNIHAVDDIKANVTRSGENSRLVNFDVSVGVTGTLENMNVAFDLSTDDDITVSNELQSMSPDQRANQAMNMLLYGIYSGAGTKGNANLGGNMLYSFLTSTVNNWMAQNVKGVDISFGVDQYDKTYDGSTTTATNYSYHVSKTLFNDRFKIIVGGSYSTDAEGSDENVAETLFNDISAEYMLNAYGTMYVRIFRHTGYESILEGEVTQTGVGFVYRRRINSLLDMFRPFRNN